MSENNKTGRSITINAAIEAGAELHLYRMWNSEREELGVIGHIDGDTVYGKDGELLGLLGYGVGDDAILDSLYAKARHFFLTS